VPLNLPKEIPKDTG